MLMSDWWADVCSSDLGAGPYRVRRTRRNDPPAAPERAGGGGGDAGDHRVDAGDAGACLAGLCRAGEHGAADRHLSADPQDSPTTDAFDSNVGIITSKPLDHYYVICLIRSEEHTSELQSLMRISYAVFCLKQKNK